MKIDNDLIAPFFVGLVTIIFTVGQIYLMPISSAEQIMDENQALFAENAGAWKEVATLTHKLEKFETTQQELIELGASPEEAATVIKAANVYDVSPKL